ncbi:MAG: amidohydrolase family protein [Propionibacteriaceae bacterium]
MTPPAAEEWRLGNVSLPDGSRADVLLRADRVTELAPAGSGTADEDLAGHVLLAGLVESHAHLDKVFTLDRTLNPDGTLAGAMASFEQVMRDSSAADLRARATRALWILIGNGVTAVRTHVGCGRLLGLRAIEALVEVRDTFAPLIDVQVVAHVGGPDPGGRWAEHVRLLRDALAAGADLVGGNPWLESDPVEAMDACFAAAIEHGCGVDFHVDETTDAGVLGLPRLAALARQTDLAVTASHCVSLGALDPAAARDVAAEVAEAAIRVVALPATNLYLQGRGGSDGAPATRGLTALDALEEAGVVVAAGGDNTLDPFNPVGRLDPLETAALMITAGHRSPATALAMVTNRARLVLGLPAAGPSIDAQADLVAVRAGNLSEVLALAPADRTVVSRGRVVSRTRVERSAE